MSQVVRLGMWLIAASLLAAPVSADTEPRVGSVDVHAVLTKSATGGSARLMLEREKSGYQAAMDVRRDELEALRKELEKPDTPMSAEVERDKRDLFERQRRDMIRLADGYQKALERHEQAVIRQMLEELVTAIREFGREQKYDRIVDSRTNKAIYERPGVAVTDSTPATDVSDEVARRLDVRGFVPR